MSRQCDRPGCVAIVVATLAYDQGSMTAWLDDAGGDADPHTYDLCRRHATTLSVPRGWDLCDRRTGVHGHLQVVHG